MATRDYGDRIRFPTATTGTGTTTQAASPVSGYRLFVAGEDGKEFTYRITDGAAWETGRSVYTHSGTTCTRVLSESSTGSLLNLSGSAEFAVDLISEDVQSFFNAAQSSEVGHRLTLTSGTPVTTADVTGATAIYCTPHVHRALPLWDGTHWRPIEVPEFGGKLQTTALGALTASKPYDDFVFSSILTPSSTDTGTDVVTFGSAHNLQTGAYCRPFDTIGGLSAGTDYWFNAATTTTGTFHTTLANALAGTSKVDLTANVTQALLFVSLEHLAWTNDSTRATGITQQDRLCKSGDKTRLLMGTFYTTATTTTEDSLRRRYLYDVYNRVMRTNAVAYSTEHTYATNTARQMNAVSTNQIEFIDGLGTFSAVVHVSGNSDGTANAIISCGFDSTSIENTEANIANAGGFPSGANHTVWYVGGAGRHFISLNERAANGTTVTFCKYGVNAHVSTAWLM